MWVTSYAQVSCVQHARDLIFTVAVPKARVYKLIYCTLLQERPCLSQNKSREINNPSSINEGTPKTNTKTITHNFGTELDYILQAILKILRSLFVQRVFLIYICPESFLKIYIYLSRELVSK
jgi:hypothetical protein